jgi:uncharacterized membrane protein YgdD (TMEM256/DUF423 family)
MTFVLIGAILGFLGVAAGAFGAHGLEGQLDTKQAEWFEKAARYQMYHALALVAVGLMPRPCRTTGLAGWLFLLGVLIFSGTLYTMALGGPRWLGAVTPIGGTSLLVAWGLLGLAAWQRRNGGTRSVDGKQRDN